LSDLLQLNPDDTTLFRWAGLIQSETLEWFNHRLMELATQLKVIKRCKLRTDSTVVETNIHHSSVSSLLANSIRVLGTTLAKEVLNEKTDLDQEVFRNRCAVCVD
jgi:transposase, IS5 family